MKPKQLVDVSRNLHSSSWSLNATPLFPWMSLVGFLYPVEFIITVSSFLSSFHK